MECPFCGKELKKETNQIAVGENLFYVEVKCFWCHSVLSKNWSDKKTFRKWYSIKEILEQRSNN